MDSGEKNGWRNFLDLCLRAKNVKELDAIFGLFLTATERSEISDRFSIVEALLSEKKTQREIAKEHRVSIAKITRGSNSLKIISPDLKRLLSS